MDCQPLRHMLKVSGENVFKLFQFRFNDILTIGFVWIVCIIILMIIFCFIKHCERFNLCNDRFIIKLFIGHFSDIVPHFIKLGFIMYKYRRAILLSYVISLTIELSWIMCKKNPCKS